MEMKWGQYHKWVGRPGHYPNIKEQAIMDELDRQNIIYRCEWSHSKCVGELGRRLFFDFALFKNSTDTTPCCIIEYQGAHHFKPVKTLEGAYERAQISDKIKRDFCAEYNIPLIEFNDTDYDQGLEGAILLVKNKYCEGTKFFNFEE